MKYLLDTNICIALLKGNDADLTAKLRQYKSMDFSICSIVKGELLYGARKSNHVEKNLTLLKKLFSYFESFSFDDTASEFYGSIRAILSKSGTPVGENDLLIASIAQANDLTLITRNKKEFVRIANLKLEVW